MTEMSNTDMKYIIERKDGRWVDTDQPYLGICELTCIGHPTYASASASARRRWGMNVKIKTVTR